MTLKLAFIKKSRSGCLAFCIDFSASFPNDGFPVHETFIADDFFIFVINENSATTMFLTSGLFYPRINYIKQSPVKFPEPDLKCKNKELRTTLIQQCSLED
jgi:hypothetical protein